MKKKVENFIRYVKKLKAEFGFKIIDSHCHSYDVMGIVHYSDDVYDNETEVADIKFIPSFGERLKFSKIGNFVTDNIARLLPKVFFSDVISTFNKKGYNFLKKEINYCDLDNIVLLSLLPWVDPYIIKKKYPDNDFLLLGSIDILQNKEEIIKEIIKQKQELGIVGIKLHPNLQDFYPQPSYNEDNIAEKLEGIYKTAEKEKLYLLFHGGVSSFTKKINPKYSNYSRSRVKGIIKNYIKDDGSSEILGKYNIPIVIAHLGHFGLNYFNKDIFKKVSSFDNVFFDTAAISPKMISSALNICKSEKIVLGSDSFYNLTAYAMYFIKLSLDRLNISSENKQKYLIKILGNNYFKNILKW